MATIAVQKMDMFSGHRDCVYALEKADGDATFFSAGGDGMVVKWNLTKPDIGELLVQVPNSIYALAYDHAQKHLWVGQNFSGIHLIDVANKHEIKSLKITGSAIFDIKLLDNNAYVALADGTVVVMDVATCVVKKYLVASQKSARCIAINPQTKEFAVGYSDNYIRIFGIDTYDLRYALEAHQNSVFTLVYSPDYRFLLSGSRDARLKAWNVWEHYQLHEEVAAHLFAINHMAFSPDASLFVTCSMDKSIKVWDYDKLKLLKVIDKARHAGHATSVNKLLWMPHKNLIVSASDDRQISVWQLSR